jgi:hypothetical protein
MPKAPPPNPMTEENKDAFDLYVRVWRERLGLIDWRVARSRKKTKNMAEVQCFHKDRLVSYRIGDDFGATPVTSKSIESTALHELLHVLLYELVNQSECGLEGDALSSAEHRVINALGHLLMAGDGG